VHKVFSDEGLWEIYKLYVRVFRWSGYKIAKNAISMVAPQTAKLPPTLQPKNKNSKVFCFFFLKGNPKEIGRRTTPGSRSESYEKKWRCRGRSL